MTIEQFSIREAAAADLTQMLELYHYLHPDDPVPDMVKAEAAWAALLASKLTSVILAEVAGKLVSSCTLVIVPILRGERVPTA